MKLAELMEERPELVDLMDVLERDCKPYLDAVMGNGLLARGIRNPGHGIEAKLPGGVIVDLYKKEVRQDRKPLHTERVTHYIIDAWFKKKFDISARSETVFCLGARGSDSILGQYGTPYFIFPIGEFSFVWSPKVSDLQVNLSFQSDIEGNDQEAIHKWLDTKGYTDKDLEGALTSDKEVMVKCKSYYCIDKDFEPQLKKALGV